MKNNQIIIKESVEDILATPVQNLRDNQIKFLEKILKVNEQRKKAPFHTLIRALLSVGSLVLATNIFSQPLTAFSIICGCCGVGATLIWAYLAYKSFTKPNYESLNTNKWSFELFLEDNGIEKVTQKLEEHLTYEANKIIESINYLNTPSNVTEKSTTVENKIETVTENTSNTKGTNIDAEV